MAENPAEERQSRFVAESLGRSIDYSQLFKQRGYGGYQTFAEIFYCIILQTGYLLYVYTQSL
jgi:hypothetical protein